jgi:hypothetical protein
MRSGVWYHKFPVFRQICKEKSTISYLWQLLRIIVNLNKVKIQEYIKLFSKLDILLDVS